MTVMIIFEACLAVTLSLANGLRQLRLLRAADRREIDKARTGTSYQSDD